MIPARPSPAPSPPWPGSDRAVPGIPGSCRAVEVMHAYIVLSLLCEIRTEEPRALRWAHVDLDGDPEARPPVPPNMAVWRSVRRIWAARPDDPFCPRPARAMIDTLKLTAKPRTADRRP